MDVRLPNGVVLKNVPEGTSKDEIRARAIRAGVATAKDFGEPSEAVAQIPKEGYPAVQSTNLVEPMSVLDYAIQGAAAVPVMAGVARGAQLLTRGSRAAPYAAELARAVIPQTGRQLAFEGALGAASGVAGGLVGEQMEPGLARELATLGAGAAVSAPFAVGRNLLEARGALGLGREAMITGGEISRDLGQMRASAQAQAAIRANPNLVPTVLRASEIEQQTGVTLPMLAASNGDTTISSFLQSQLSRGENVEFAAKMKGQYEAAEKALTQAKRGLAPSMQEVDTYVKRKAAEVAAANQKAAAEAAARATKREQGLENIDNRILELSSIQAQKPEVIGGQLTNLLKAKESAIRAELSPQYQKLIDESMSSGITLSGEAANNLRRFVIDEQNTDVFNKFPKLYSLIKKEFSTPPVAAGTKAASKYTFARTAAETRDVPLTSLDSLKRAVNQALRENPTPDQLRKLVQLKQQVDGAIDSVDPAFSAPYRQIDKEYATRLGIPFNEQGIININRAQFDEKTVPRLTSNPSELNQVLGVIGDSPEGLKIVEDAFIYDISKNRSIINTNTGEINPNQLKRYIAQKQSMLEKVPGLKEKLEGLQNNVQALRDNRTALLEAQKQDKVKEVENLWSQAYGTREGLSGLVRQSLSNPAQLDNLLNLSRGSKVANEAIKAAMLDDILNAPGDRLALFTQNKDAITKVFGKNQAQQMEYLVEASQRLKDNPFKMNMNIKTISKSEYESLTGSRPEQTLGEARNQILSAPRVLLNHLSRYFQNKASKDEAAEVQRFLLDPKNLELTAKLTKELDSKGFTEKAAGLLKQVAKNSSSVYLLGALSGNFASQTGPSAQPYTPTDAGLLEGYGQ